MEKQEESRIYSDRVRAGRRTYFFDIKSNSEGGKYLLITESKKVDENEFQRRTIMVQDKDIEKIKIAFGKAIEEMEGYISSDQAE